MSDHKHEFNFAGGGGVSLAFGCKCGATMVRTLQFRPNDTLKRTEYVTVVTEHRPYVRPKDIYAKYPGDLDK